MKWTDFQQSGIISSMAFSDVHGDLYALGSFGKSGRWLRVAYSFLLLFRILLREIVPKRMYQIVPECTKKECTKEDYTKMFVLY